MVRVSVEEICGMTFGFTVLLTKIDPTDLDMMFEWLRGLTKIATGMSGEEIDAGYRIVSDPRGTLFSFEDVETAAFFKLRWGE